MQRWIVVTLVFSLSAAVLHIELWPFSRWNIFSEKLHQPVYEVRVVGVDASGQEHSVDRRAFEPFASIDLYTWLDFHFAKLSIDEKKGAAKYLLAQMNRAREDARAGRRIGRFERYLGPGTAPVHILHAKIWQNPARVPAFAFVGMRIYVERWNVWERRENPSRVRRELRYEYLEDRP